MATTTFRAAGTTHVMFLVGTTGTDTVLAASPTNADDSNVATGRKNLIQASGDLTTSVGGQKIALGPFLETNAVTSISGVAQTLGEVAGMTQIAVPFAGSVVGVSACGNANITAGTLRVAVSVNGATVFSAVNAATGVKVIRATQAKDVDVLAAGDRVGIKLTTSADLAPETIEWVMYAFIEQ